MIIENKGEFYINEILDYKHEIHDLDFKNISEIKNLHLLNELKLLTELKFSTCFVENDKLDLSQTTVNSLTIANCYFDINNIVIPPNLRKFIVRLETIYDLKIYEKLKNLIKLEYDLCDFKALISNDDIQKLIAIEMISFTNCKGLLDMDALLVNNRPINILLKNTDFKMSTNLIHDGVHLEIETDKKTQIKENLLITVSK